MCKWSEDGCNRQSISDYLHEDEKHNRYECLEFNVKAARMFGWIRAVLFVTILITHWFSFVDQLSIQLNSTQLSEE